MSAPPPSPARRERRIPRWLLVLGVPIVGVLLVAFFVFLQFPFDRFRDTLARQAGLALGAEVQIGGLDPAFSLGGPGFVARDVLVRWPDGEKAMVERAALRPAWSPSWLRGQPALHVDADSDLGTVDGAFTLGEAPAFDGALEAVALGRLPLERWLGGAQVEGRLDLEGDLSVTEAGPVGRVSFESRDGSVATAQLPIAIPYETLVGALDFADDGSIAIEDVTLEGPMVSASVAGGAKASPSLLLAPLEIDVRLEVRDPNLRPAFSASGVRLGRDGSVELKIRGNLAAPVIR